MTAASIVGQFPTLLPADPAKRQALFDRRTKVGVQPDERKVNHALAYWMQENEIPSDTYDHDYIYRLPGADVEINLGPNQFLLEGLKAHDMHHRATGYGTDPVGELEVTAWETGARGPLWARAMLAGGVLWGLMVAPSRVWSALKKGWQGGTNLFGNQAGYAAVLGSTVGQMRQQLGVPLGGLTSDH